MSKPQKRRTWTAEEIEYLKDNIGTKSFNAIAKKLNRTETAVIGKGKRLGLGTYSKNTDLLNINEVAEMLDINRKTAWDIINSGQIKNVRKNIRGKTYRIFCRYEDVLKFKRTYHKQSNRIWSEYEKSILRMCLQRGFSQEQIGKRLNRSTEAVSHKVAQIRRQYEL